MERVQFQQEQMLAELKDLGEKGLFSPTEIKHIIKKRTAFETALVRRIPNKNDYLRYAAYEMGLEALRRKRATRLKLPKSPPSISDHALTRRQFHIFERALKKFKSDVSLWQQYLRLAQRAGARALAGRIAARAVQLHPRTPALYVLAAAHELSYGGIRSARVLLQRGLRLNDGSVEMWREYVRLELGFIEAMRRRWDLLGISLSSGKGKGKSDGDGNGVDDDDDDDNAHGDGELELEQGERADKAEEEVMGDAARRAIMDGAIVRQAIDSAAKALPKVELFQSLQTLIASYPTPESLRSALLDHLHARMTEVLPGDAAGVVLRATRALALTPAEDLAGGALVDALRRANEEMLAAIETDAHTDNMARHFESSEAMTAAYAQFIEEWCGKEDVDANIKLYLVGNLHSLIKRRAETRSPAPALLAAHIRLLITLAHLPTPPTQPSRILRIARRYTSTVTVLSTLSDSNAVAVWLARLNAESTFGSVDSVAEAWTSARRAIPTHSAIWLWGADRCCPSSSSRSTASSWEEFDALLAESMSDAALREVHQSLLLRVADSLNGLSNTAERRARIEHIARRCLPSAHVWERVFTVLTMEDDDDDEAETETEVETDEKEEKEKEKERLLREVYEYWRDGTAGEVEEEKEEGKGKATLAWAKWLLLRKKRGDEAMKVIARARGGRSGAVLARGWAAVVQQQQAEATAEVEEG